jgi:hypothetical protein
MLARPMARRLSPVLPVLSLGLMLAACPAPAPAPHTEHHAAAGPRLHLTAGEERTPGRLVLEIDTRIHPVGPATLHTFRFTIEEKTDPPTRSHARVHARLVEVEGASGQPKLSDRLALAMDDLKLSFTRNERGETYDLQIEDLRDPLNEPMVRAIAYTLFGVERGPRLPEQPRQAQDDYQVEQDIDILGVTVHQRHFFTFLGERGGEVSVREKGHAEGIATTSSGSRRKIDGDTFSKETFDLDRGTIVSGEYEWTVVVEDDPLQSRETPGVGKTHVRAERGRAVAPPAADE